MPPAAKKTPKYSKGAAELRRRAEAQHSLNNAHADSVSPGVDTQRLLHELQVHQIELEMQNEELRQARAELEAGLERYTDLYDFAPVGYFTLGRDGNVGQVNLSGARLLGVERSHLVGRRFGVFVRAGDLLIFNTFLANVFAGKANETCEITLNNEETPRPHARERTAGSSAGKAAPTIVRIEATAAGDEQTCRAMVFDITQRRLNEESLRLLVEQKIRRTEELEALTYIMATMRQAKKMVTMMPLLVVQSTNAMKSQAGILALLEGESLNFSSGMGIFEAYNGTKLPQGKDLLWEIALSGNLQVVDDLSGKNLDFEKNSFFGTLTQDLGACVIAPLKVERATIGLLILGYSKPIVFTVNQMRLVTAISDMAGSTLHRMSATEKLEKIVVNRNWELESIYRITSAASETLERNAAFKKALGVTLQAVKANAGAIFLLNEAAQHLELIVAAGLPNEVQQKIKDQTLENSLEGRVIRQNQPLLLPNLASDSNLAWNTPLSELKVYAGFPMRVHDRVVGVLSIARAGDQQLILEEITLLSFITNHLGLIEENFRLFKQEENQALMEERSRMARELHDSIIQLLSDAGLFSTSAQEAITHGDLEKVSSDLKQSSLMLDQALIKMRLMVYSLGSQVLATNGLIAALHHRLDSVEKQSGIKVKFKNNELPLLTTLVEDGLYQVIMEALNNAYRHAKAGQMEIKISSSRNKLSAVIEDNGVGFDLFHAAESGGAGLSSMREQVQNLDGSLEITSAPGAGTRISISIPIKK